MIYYYTCILDLTKGKFEFQFGSDAILPKDDLPALCNIGGQKMEKCGKLTLIKAVLFWVTEVIILFRNVSLLPHPFHVCLT